MILILTLMPGAVMALVSPWAGYITGQVVEVNGGAFM